MSWKRRPWWVKAALIVFVVVALLQIYPAYQSALGIIKTAHANNASSGSLFGITMPIEVGAVLDSILQILMKALIATLFVALCCYIHDTARSKAAIYAGVVGAIYFAAIYFLAGCVTHQDTGCGMGVSLLTSPLIFPSLILDYSALRPVWMALRAMGMPLEMLIAGILGSFITLFIVVSIITIVYRKIKNEK